MIKADFSAFTILLECILQPQPLFQGHAILLQSYWREKPRWSSSRVNFWWIEQHPYKGDPVLSALFLQHLAWGRLKNYLCRTLVASSLFCNIKGPEIASMKGCSLMKLYFASQWETQDWAMQKKNLGATTLVDSVFEIDKLAEEEFEVQHTPSPHLQPL